MPVGIKFISSSVGGTSTVGVGLSTIVGPTGPSGGPVGPQGNQGFQGFQGPTGPGNVINNSSTIIHKSVIDKAGLQKLIKYEDYEYWKECIKHTNFIYLNECTIGYDTGHGGGVFYSL